MAVLHKNLVRETFLGLSAEELNETQQQARSYLDAFNLFRGWKSASGDMVTLDPLPFVLEHQEMEFLQTGLAQWARILTALYHDLWGPQTLVQNGIVSVTDLWRDAGFEPGYAGGLPEGADPLTVVGFTLQRNGDRWQVVKVDTERPSGLGYSLEDRIVHSRCFFSTLRPENLLRMAPFFVKLKELWYRRESPTVMVWTEGPEDRDYFEPVYLARYFGFPLVESRDLTVRSGKVYLKTLGGLQPVDLLMRWVSDSAIDPLVGNPPPASGVAGLAQAVRDGRLGVSNAPGAGLLARPVMMERLAACATALTGESLTIPVAAPGGGGNTLQEPYWSGTDWQERPALLRVFLARFTDGWQMMPGGILESTADGRTARKDVWMLEPTAVPQVSLLPEGEKPSFIVRAGELPSRVADDLFWLGRYTERAWFDARVLETWWQATYQAGIEAHLPMPELLTEVLRETGAAKAQDENGDDLEPWDPRGWRLATTLSEVERISSHVLDRLSAETHRILGSFGSRSMPEARSLIPRFFEDLNLRLAALNGLTNENMTRSAGWRFLDMGRRFERAGLGLATVTAFFSRDTTDQALTVLLELFDSSLTYRSRYRLTPQPAPVLDLLLLDETNPRSFAFQVEQLSAHIDELPRPLGRAHRSVEERLILELSTAVRLANIQSVDPDTTGDLFARLDGILDSLDQAIHDRYLAKIDAAAALQPRLREPQ